MKLLFARSAFCLVALLLATSTAHAQQAEPRRDLQGLREDLIAPECRAAKAATGKDQTPSGILFNKEAQRLYCDCLPAEIIRLEARMTNRKSSEEMLKVVDQAMDICEAQQYSRTIPALCPTFAGGMELAADVKAYCACVAAKVRGLPGTDLHAQIAQATRDAAARKDEKQLPPEFLAIRHFGAQCPR